MCRPSAANWAQGPAARMSNISRRSAGSAGILSKLSIGHAWIALPVPPILGGWQNVSTRDPATAAYQVAESVAYLTRHLSTFIPPTATPEERWGLEQGSDPMSSLCYGRDTRSCGYKMGTQESRAVSDASRRCAHPVERSALTHVFRS